MVSCKHFCLVPDFFLKSCLKFFKKILAREMQLVFTSSKICIVKYEFRSKDSKNLNTVQCLKNLESYIIPP